MNRNNEFLASVLRRTGRALAGYASGELLEKHPEAATGFEPDPFAGWQNWLSVRVEELASAVKNDRPQMFVSQVLWGRAALESRGISPESFRNGLVCLRAVLASELPEELQDMGCDYVDQALDAFDQTPAELSAPLLPDTEMGRLASKYLLVLLEGDRRHASRLILDALNRGHGVRELYLKVLLPAQAELGRMWLVNEINVAEEHFASQTTKMVMAQLLPHATIQPANGKTMLAAAVTGNQHDIGLQTVADFFEMDGWRTISLGADVPVHDLVQAVDCFSVDLLGLSASQVTQLDAVKTTIEAIRSSSRAKDLKILLGGPAFGDPDELARALGADGYAVDADRAVSLGRRLVGLDESFGGQ